MTGSRMDSLTDVPGLRVGHAEVPGGESGCTVVLGSLRGVVEVRGSATGTRELHTMDPSHLVPSAQAILLTGGSAFGLAAADGVMAWLEERGEGFDTGVARVPIVPSAVLFDLAPGRPRPGPEEGRRACESATSGPVPMGRVGAGAGATVGKILGLGRASPGGIGSAGTRVGEWTVAALVAVNALGQVNEADGRTVAGVRGDPGFLDSDALVLEEGGSGDALGAGTNTTLAVVATDAPLGAGALTQWLRVASTALARRISPVNTPFDGDVVFGITTAETRSEAALESRDILRLGVAARNTLETAILRGVSHS